MKITAELKKRKKKKEKKKENKEFIGDSVLNTYVHHFNFKVFKLKNIRPKEYV